MKLSELIELYTKAERESPFQLDLMKAVFKEKYGSHFNEDMMKADISVQSADSKGPLQITMYGPVYPHKNYVSTNQLEEILENEPKDRDLQIRLKSPGGSAFEGHALYSYLRRWEGNVAVEADGLVASAAALMFLGGDDRLVTKETGSVLMFHRAWIYLWAAVNKPEFTKMYNRMGQALDMLDQSTAEALNIRAGMDASKTEDFLDEEKFLTGKESIEMGIATGYIQNKKKKKKKANSESGASNSVEDSEAFLRSLNRSLFMECEEHFTNLED